MAHERSICLNSENSIAMIAPIVQSTDGVTIVGGGPVGLGLAICRAIVEVHGGTIEGHNRQAAGLVQGARFDITLPCGTPAGRGAAFAAFAESVSPRMPSMVPRMDENSAGMMTVRCCGEVASFSNAAT